MATIRNPYKNDMQRRAFDTCIALYNDRSSEFWHNGQPRRGAGHRAAFWDGVAGIKRSAHMGEASSFARACWRAGLEVARVERPKITITMPPLGARVFRLEESAK